MRLQIILRLAIDLRKEEFISCVSKQEAYLKIFIYENFIVFFLDICCSLCYLPRISKKNLKKLEKSVRLVFKEFRFPESKF